MPLISGRSVCQCCVALNMRPSYHLNKSCSLPLGLRKFLIQNLNGNCVFIAHSKLHWPCIERLLCAMCSKQNEYAGKYAIWKHFFSVFWICDFFAVSSLVDGLISGICIHHHRHPYRLIKMIWSSKWVLLGSWVRCNSTNYMFMGRNRNG